MTKEEIDDLMRDNGIVVVGEAVYTLCQLVAAHEREECAKVCEAMKHYMDDGEECAKAIRARSNT